MPIKWLRILFQKIRYYRRKILPFALGALVILVPLVILTIKNANLARADWYNDNWLYRTNWVFTENTTAITSEREVEFTVDTASLISAGKLQADCDDLRFTDAQGDLLPYDITGTCNNASTTIDVLYNEIIVGDTLTYMYYGNDTAFAGDVGTAFGATVYTPDSGPTEGSENQGPGPVMYLKFDEGYGSTVQDSAEQGNNGTITNASRQDQSLCILSSCIHFDGDTDYITVSDSSTLDFAASAGFTVQSWFKHPTDASGTQTILEKYESSGGDGGYVLRMESDGDLSFGVDDANGDYADDIVTSTSADYDDGEWHFVVGVKSGTSSISLYVDGVLIGSDTSIASTGTLANDDDLYIGVGGDGTSNDFVGYIDEVKIYPYARSLAEIKTDLVKGFTLSGAPAVVGQETGNSFRDDLLAYWTMDEFQFTVAQDRADYSENSSDLTDSTITASNAGIYDKSVDFDGSSDYLYTADNSVLSLTGSFTMSAWIRPDAVTGSQSIAGKWDTGGSPDNDSYLLELNGDELRMYIDSSSNYEQTDALNVSTSTWYHVVVLYDADTSSVTFYIDSMEEASSTTGTIPSSISDESGRFHVGAVDSSTSATNFYNGRVDDLRIYGRLLSSDEIDDLYNYAPPPAAYWNFNEGSGTTAYDVTGNGQNATLTNMTDANWVNGVYGKALDFLFDSPQDHLVVASNDVNEPIDEMGPVTLSMWLKTDFNTAGRRIFDKTNRLYLEHAGSNNLRLIGLFSGTNLTVTGATNMLTQGVWQYITVTWNGETAASGVHFYVDGVEVGISSSTSATGTPSNDGTLDLIVGNRSGVLNRVYIGSIDDLRVYSYVRSQSQIIQDMNGIVANTSTGDTSSSYYTSEWLFDGVFADTAYDSNSAYKNNGNLAGTGTACPNTGACPTIVTSGKTGGALDFDGSDDYVEVSADTSLDLYGKTYYSMCAWVNPDSDGEGNTGEFISKGSTYIGVSSESGGQVNVTANIDLATTDASITSARTIPINTWSHVCAVLDESLLTLYINGIYDSADTGSGAPSDDSASNLNIGGDSTDNFDGTIDTVRVFTSALTPAQVKTDYNDGFGIALGTETRGTLDAYGDPPVVFYDFNENTGTSTLFDKSGNGYDGDLNNVAESIWIPGIHGSAVQLDGSNDFINTNYGFIAAGTAFSVSLWVRDADSGIADSEILGSWAVTSGPDEYLEIYFDSTGYDCSAGELAINFDDTDAAAGDDLCSNQTMYGEQWYHIVFTHKPGGNLSLYINGVLDNTSAATSESDGQKDFTTYPIYLGAFNNQGTTDFEANIAIDDFKIYDYELTAGQVAYEYSQGAPFGWWKLDECQGTTVYDSGIGKNNGTISSGASGTNTSAGTCDSGNGDEMWDNGTNGKNNASLHFDSTNDVVNFGDVAALEPTGPITLTAWVKNPADTAGTVVSKMGDSGFRGYQIFFLSTPSLRFAIASNSTTTYVTEYFYEWTDTWQHVAATYEPGVETALYVNGEKVASRTDSVPSAQYTNNGQDFLIGARDGGSPSYFNGQIDDVRFYYYAMTPAQIKDVMSQGAVRFE